MIKVYVSNNTGSRDYAIIDENTTTPRTVLEEKGVDLSRGTFAMDGASMQPGDMNKTFAALGYDGSDPTKNKAFITQISKLDNASR